MAGDIQIRTVRVELLRAGPAHNQLLSPLTPYLGVCDDSDAGLVHVPFEQHVFDRRMRAMRHERIVGDAGSQPTERDHLPDLRDLGVAMARLLGAVPRLPGALTGDPGGRDTLVRLALTLSAAELAGLPFELAKVPIGPDSWTESWLSLQSKVPVVITRRTRNASVTNAGLKWMQAPRILFVAAGGAGSAEVPFDDHLNALVNAVLPFVLPDRQGRRKLSAPRRMAGGALHQTLGAQLTVLSNATLDSLMHECSRRPYTHVHILAHGRQDDRLGDRSHGLGLGPEDGVISGERLASALAGVVQGRLHRPQVVTLATCDSGNPGPVVYPGASIAHALHQAGIPLVVASQVPLTFEASAQFAREFYAGLLWGEHPWVLMHRARASLHGRQKPDDHDWASLVVYESLPAELGDALEEAALRQCERALDVVFATKGMVTPQDRLSRVLQDLIRQDGRYAMEAYALRAEVRMRGAWRDAYDAWLLDGESGRRPRANDRAQADELRQRSLWSMEQALSDYEQAVDGFLVNPGQGLNAPFRALLAQMALRLVVHREFDFGTWSMARHWAQRAAERSPDPKQKVWALGCLALLHLVALADPLAKPAEHANHVEDAKARVREMAMVHERTPDHAAVRWVSEQLVHFRDWWADPGFQRVVLQRRGGGADLRKLPERLHEAAAGLGELLDYLAGLVPTDCDDDPAECEAPASASAPAPAPTTGPAPASAAAAEPPPQLLAQPARPPAGAHLSLELLPVAQGDCLWLEWGQGRQRWRMLVDCGTEGSFDEALGPRIARLPKKERRFELFILSHIDGDHIGGGIPLLQQAKALGLSFGDIWFNGREHLEPARMLSGKDGDDFTTLLKREKLPWNQFTGGKAIVRRVGADGSEAALPTCTLAGGLKLTVLSPVPKTLLQLAGTWDKDLKAPGRRRVLARGKLELREDLDAIVRNPFNPDGSRPNGSSIAVLVEFAGKALLLGADAYADVLASAVAKLLPRGQPRLALDAFKVSHHGSRGNVNDELMALLDCEHFLISTSGAVFNHPDREALARLVRRSPRPATLWFNHPLPEDEREYHAFWATPAVQKKWRFAARYPAQPGLVFNLLGTAPPSA